MKYFMYIPVIGFALWATGAFAQADSTTGEFKRLNLAISSSAFLLPKIQTTAIAQQQHQQYGKHRPGVDLKIILQYKFNEHFSLLTYTGANIFTYYQGGLSGEIRTREYNLYFLPLLIQYDWRTTQKMSPYINIGFVRTTPIANHILSVASNGEIDTDDYANYGNTLIERMFIIDDGGGQYYFGSASVGFSQHLSRNLQGTAGVTFMKGTTYGWHGLPITSGNYLGLSFGLNF